MKQEKKIYKHPLSRRILIGCAVFCVCLCFFTGVFGAVIYTRGMFDRYEAYMKGILQYVQKEIDGEDLQWCMENNQKSSLFLSEQEMLDRIKENYEIEYIYIVKPINDTEYNNMMNVMAGATDYEKEHEADTLSELGQLTGNAYSAKVAANYLNAMKMNTQDIFFFSNKTEYGYDYTGLTAIRNDKGEAIAILAVDISINEITNVLLRYMAVIFCGVIILTGIFLCALYRWLSRKVIIPIFEIQKAAEQFIEDSHGQTNLECIVFEKPDICSEDEIQSLSESIATMAADLKTYMQHLIEETKETERISTELDLAAKIQADMLPNTFPAFPDRKEFNIFALMNPAREVGGDFYDFFLVDEKHLAVVIADVSGKGIPAALFMAIGKTLIKDHTKPDRSLGEVFSEVNSMLCDANKEGLFITAFEGVLNLETGEFRYVNAGHEPPYICRYQKKYEKYKVRPGFVLAGMEEMRYKEGCVSLYKGDRIFLYTDGVTEAQNKACEMYGEKRLYRILNEQSMVSPEQLLNEIQEDVHTFTDGAQQFDDITMLCMEYLGKR